MPFFYHKIFKYSVKSIDLSENMYKTSLKYDRKKFLKEKKLLQLHQHHEVGYYSPQDLREVIDKQKIRFDNLS